MIVIHNKFYKVIRDRKLLLSILTAKNIFSEVFYNYVAELDGDSEKKIAKAFYDLHYWHACTEQRGTFGVKKHHRYNLDYRPEYFALTSETVGGMIIPMTLDPRHFGIKRNTSVERPYAYLQTLALAITLFRFKYFCEEPAFISPFYRIVNVPHTQMRTKAGKFLEINLENLVWLYKDVGTVHDYKNFFEEPDDENNFPYFDLPAITANSAEFYIGNKEIAKFLVVHVARNVALEIAKIILKNPFFFVGNFSITEYEFGIHITSLYGGLEVFNKILKHIVLKTVANLNEIFSDVVINLENISLYEFSVDNVYFDRINIKLGSVSTYLTVYLGSSTESIAKFNEMSCVDTGADKKLFNTLPRMEMYRFFVYPLKGKNKRCLVNYYTASELEFSKILKLKPDVSFSAILDYYEEILLKYLDLNKEFEEFNEDATACENAVKSYFRKIILEENIYEF